MSKYKLNTDVSVIFKNESNRVELKITLEDLIQKREEELFELLEDEHNPCTCTISESQNFCECGGAFEDYEIVEIEIANEQQKRKWLKYNLGIFKTWVVYILFRKKLSKDAAEALKDCKAFTPRQNKLIERVKRINNLT